jgi:ABC-type oligopeptide transport system substrate-binding subunit
VRKVGLLAMGALLVSAAFAPSVSAAASAGGSCGYRAGSYGLNTLGPRPGERNVSTGFAQATYSGVTPGTHVRVMSYAGLADDDKTNGCFGSSGVVGLFICESSRCQLVERHGMAGHRW